MSSAAIRMSRLREYFYGVPGCPSTCESTAKLPRDRVVPGPIPVILCKAHAAGAGLGVSRSDVGW